MFYELAENLIHNGYSVTPVKDKRPFITGWQKLHGEVVLGEAFSSMWNRANGIGVLTGEVSGIICLDIDIVNPDDPVLAELNKILPPLYCGLVGDKLKPPARFFRFNGERSEKFINIGVEILSDGNQKVIPPSKHPKGFNYEWVGTSLERNEPEALPSLPQGVIEFLRQKNEQKRNSEPNFNDPVKLVSESGRCKHGSHNLISKEALKLFHAGHDFYYIVDRIMELDLRINNDEGDVLYFLCSSRPEFRTKSRFTNARQMVAEVFFRNMYKLQEKEFFKEELENGFTWRESEGAKKYARQYSALYTFINNKHDLYYLPEMRSFAYYTGKKYEFKSEDHIKHLAQTYFKSPVCTSIGERNTFLDYCKNKRQTDIKDFNLSDKSIINLKNGAYSLREKRLIPHTKEHKVSYIIDIDWQDSSDAPTWETLLDIICLGRETMVRAIEEFVGYILSGCSYHKFNKLLILDGSGSNGKSTLIRIIQDLVGRENTSSVSLEAITSERFAGFSLVNKLVNFCSEEPKEAFAQTGAIKKITGGDSIMVEQKHKGAFQYENIAKLIISYNKMPFFPDDSTGMKRRIILIPCEMNFEKQPELKIQNVEDKIKEEFPAVLRRCVKAYEKVITRGHFTEVSEGRSRVDEMIVESSPVLSFIDEELEIIGGEENFIDNEKLYAAFEQFNGGKTRYSRNRALKAIKGEVYKNNDLSHLKDRVKRTVTGVKRGVYGVRFREFS